MHKAKIMGILNTTPDSFSDGGKYINVNDAVKHAIKLVSYGADIIDIGAESTHPKSTRITPEEEWRRLKDILPEVSKFKVDLSLDSKNFVTIEKSLQYNIKYVNDISGAKDPRIIDLIKNTNIKYILMHNPDIYADFTQAMSEEKPIIEQLQEWFDNEISKLLDLGLSQEQIIIDPGIGFGKNLKPEHNIQIINNLNELKILGYPILLGHSRKYFYNLLGINDAGDRDLETLITSLHVIKSVDIFRVHNVEWHTRAFALMKKLQQEMVLELA